MDQTLDVDQRAGRIPAAARARIPHGPTDGGRSTGTTTQTYTYDDAGQLTQVNQGAATTAYTYDAVGNRANQTSGTTTIDYVYDPASQLTAAVQLLAGIPIAAVAVTHDGAGRTTAVAGSRTRSFLYDDAGRLAQTRDVNGLAVTTTTRTYDGDDALVTLSSQSGLAAAITTQLDWDHTRPVPQVAALNAGSGPVNLLYGPNRAAAIRSNQSDYFSYDAHGSAITDADTADLVTATSYNAYGQPETPINLVDAVAGQLLTTKKVTFGYRGELTADGLVHLRARDYAPGVGRFTTKDPLDGIIGEVAVANPYPYAANDPLNQIDPLGLSPISDNQLQVVFSFDFYLRPPGWATMSQDERLAAIADQLGPAFVAAQSNKGEQARITLADLVYGLLTAPQHIYQSLYDAGAQRVDEYIDATGHIPSGLDILNISSNPAYRALDKCSGRITNADYVECAFAVTETIGTAVTVQQLTATSARIVVSAARGLQPAGAGVVDPMSIRFTQNSVSQSFSSGNSIDELVTGLRTGTVDARSVPPIRIFERNGEWYTLDNRRLVAFQQARVDVPYRLATPEEIAAEGWKLTTTNDGTSVRIRGGGGTWP